MLKKVTIAAQTPGSLRLYHKYRAHSMVPRWRFVDNLNLARCVEVDGDLVECGTWKGGMIAAMAELLGRRAVLFDSYEGLPEVKPIDGPAAIAWQNDTLGEYYFDNCTASEQDAIDAMTLAGVEYEIRKGWFADTVPAYADKQPTLAILRLDGDWYDSTIVCLEHLYPLVSPGGLVLIDDYGEWDGCTRAVHEYLSRTGATEDIRCSPWGVAYLRKR